MLLVLFATLAQSHHQTDDDELTVPLLDGVVSYEFQLSKSDFWHNSTNYQGSKMIGANDTTVAFPHV